jgi:hypothetical protein
MALRGGGEEAGRAAWIGCAGAGLLAGLRLSYLPLLLVPVALVLWHSPYRLRAVGAGIAGVLAWLVPMTLDTGLAALVDVAWTQAHGHFTEFGGTVQTNPDLGRRLAGLVEGLWADGLGAWWPGRHALTAVVGLGALGTAGAGVWRLVRRAAWRQRGVQIVAASAATYAVWIFFFQNVIHKSRHVLPLLPLGLILLAAGAAAVWQAGRGWGRAAVVLGGAAYLGVTLVLVGQHLQPTAVAQAKQFVEAQQARADSAGTTVRVASVPLINNYLQAQRVDGPYLSVEDSSDVQRLRRLAGPFVNPHRDDEAGDPPVARTLVIGTYADLVGRPPDRVRTFYHNPYVNRMWPEVKVHVYKHPSTR